MSTENQITLIDQLRNLETQIQAKTSEIKTINDTKENTFKAVSQKLNEKFLQIKNEYLEDIRKSSEQFENEIEDLKKQRDDIETKIFGKVYSETVISLHDIYDIVQKIITNNQ